MTTLPGVIEAFLLSLLGASPGGQKIEDAQSAIRGFLANEGAVISWKGLDKKVWCDRIIELLGDPKKFDQGHTEYCLAAACLIVLFKRAPVTMADFCRDLANTGKGKINELTIAMTKEIQDYDVPAYAAQRVKPVDFILLLAIQNAMSPSGFFSKKIKTPQDASPATLASNIKDILEGTKLFTITEINPNSPALTNQTADADIILVGWLKFFKTALATQRHAVVLAQPMKEDGGKIVFRYWSWGMVETDLVPGIEPHHDEHNIIDYYEQKCTPSEFSSGIGTVYVATLK